MPDEVVDTLLEVCQSECRHLPALLPAQSHAGWAWKSCAATIIYAPVAKSDKTYAFDRAAGMVLGFLQQFRPAHLAELAERVFAERPPRQRGAQGQDAAAPSAPPSMPDLTPWVLLNYQGRADDVATMAHELGHAIHSMLAEQHSLFTLHSCLPLAETASTFGEMMLVDRLLADETDEAVRRDLLFRQVDDAYATIQRQAFFALFEKQAHEMIASGRLGGRTVRSLHGKPARPSSATRWSRR